MDEAAAPPEAAAVHSDRTTGRRKSNWARRFSDLDRYDALIIGILAGAFLVIQLGWFLRPVATGGDQLDYLSTAGDLQETRITHRHLRIGLTLPVRVLTDAFGYSEVAYYGVPIAAGLLFLIATYLLGALLHSRAAGAIGAIAATFNAHLLWGSSHLLPDLLAAGLFTMALVVLGASRDREPNRWNPGLVGAGLLLGWSYLTREFMVLFFPLALVTAWMAGRAKIRDLAQISVGALAMLSVELVYGALLFGDPVAHIRRVVSFKGPSLSTPAPSIGGTGQGNSLIEMAGALPGELMHGRGGGGLFVLLGACLVVGGVGIVAMRRTDAGKRLLVPLVWMLMVYAVLTLSGWSTNGRGGSVINITKIRYWYPIFPAVTVGGAIGLLALFDGERMAHWVRRGAAMALTTAVILGSWASLDAIDHSNAFVGNGGGAEFREFRQWLVANGGDVDRLYVDAGHGRSLYYSLPMFTRTAFGRSLWPGEIDAVPVQNPVAASQLDGIVVVHRDGTEWMAGRDLVLPYLQDVPESWPPLMVSDNGMLAVFDTGEVGLDQAPVVLGPATADGPAGVTMTAAGGWELGLADGESIRLLYPLEGAVPAATTSSIELTDDAMGDGSIAVFCAFGDDQHELAFNVTQTPGDPAASEFFCEGPQLRSIELMLTGPLQGTIEGVEARITTPAP